MIKFEESEKANVQGPEGERGRLYGDEVLIRDSAAGDEGNHSRELELYSKIPGKSLNPSKI